MRNKSIQLLVATLISLPLSATNYIVNTASEINKGKWTAGDTVRLADGNYANCAINFQGRGSAEAPIVFMAEHAGKACMTDGTYINIKGSYLEVHGLNFTSTSQAKKGAVTFNKEETSHCRLTNCRIDGYNPEAPTIDFKWVNIHGTDNRVDHCSFMNKEHMGTLLVVWLIPGQEARHIIDHNYFGSRTPLLDEKGSEINGQETIRIGDSKSSLTNARCVIEYNLFHHCDGEIECISNKSCENIYRGNTFFEQTGALCLRHGHRCIVDGNVFLGNDYVSPVSNTASAGIRIMGEGHKVTNNYLYKVKGSGYRAALSFTKGNENAVLNRYSQIKDVIVAFNTFVDCHQAIEMGAGSAKDQSYLPERTKIYNNLVYNNTNATVLKMEDGENEGDIDYKKNYYNKGAFKNISKGECGFSTLFKLQMMNAYDEYAIQEPQISSFGNIATQSLNDVTTDIFGRQRPQKSIPGCSLVEGAAKVSLATPTNTGIKW